MAASVLAFTNVHGEAPSEPLAADAPVTVHKRPDGRVRSNTKMGRLRQRLGRDGIDLKQCQAPAGDRTGAVRCAAPPTVVMVENNKRADGSIGALALCQRHANLVVSSQGADYAKMTPLTGKQ